MSRKEEGILRIYQSNGKIEYPNVADFTKTEGFRLPTEVEWEWFARGGEIAIQDGTFNYKYSGSNNTDEVAWNKNNSENCTHDVGMKKPNQLGLYDCCGNIWEWCYDTSGDGYIPEKTPYRYDESVSGNRLKGGSFYSSTEYFSVFNCVRDGVILELWNGSEWVRLCPTSFRIVRTI